MPLFISSSTTPVKSKAKSLFTTLSLFSLLSLTACSQFEVDSSNDFENNGLDKTGIKRDALYLKESLPPGLPYPDPSFQTGLDQQMVYLNKLPERTYELEDTKVSVQQLKQVTNEIQHWLTQPTYQPQLKALQLAGQDYRGNVQITGYYVPVISVRHKPDAVYRYPLYRKPLTRDANGQFPNREQIDFEHALQGQGLEIAYSADLVDNFFLHVQGSGVVQYEDGTRELLSWGGVNGWPYRSLGKILIENGEIARADISAQSIKRWLKDHPDKVRETLSQNPSYLFFSEGLSAPVGAANVPLTPLYSVAVDPKVIPLGSILLGEMPKLDQQGNLIGHQFRLLLAQDKGGAIKGPGHIDWYQGIGDEAHVHAGQLKHFGKVWLLLPNKKETDLTQ
ncbi:MAG: murein transglycosylase A [Marinomonas sp.]|uniref:murein transglycosylase A n=1 Tax=Marinomonas sp. TaxID=1904862 RepID=UPI003C7797C4